MLRNTQRRPRRTTQLLGAALLGTVLTLPMPASVADDEAHRTLDLDSPASVIDLGEGNRVQLTEIGTAGRSILQPMPRDDGTTPGLILSTVDGTTTVEATDSGAAPTLVDGPAMGASESKFAGDDLVELRFEAIGRDGRPAVAHVNIFDVKAGALSAYRSLPGSAVDECTSASSSPAPCILVPSGTYSLMALVTTMPRDQPSDVKQYSVQNVSLTGDPEVTISRDRTITFDARKAQPVTVRTPGNPTKTNAGGALEIGYTRTAANGRSVEIAQRPTSLLDPTFYLQPTERVQLGGLRSNARLRLEAPDIQLTTPHGGPLHPEYYDPVWFSDFSSQFPMYDGRRRLRVVDVGNATAQDLHGLDLRGAIAVAERSDDISVADQSNGAAEAGATIMAIYNNTPGDNGDPNGTGTMLEIPTVRLARAEGLQLLKTRAGDRVIVQGEPTTPYVYDLVLQEEDAIPSDMTYTLPKGRLSAQVRAFHGQPTKASTYSEAAYPWGPDDTFSLSTLFPLRGGAQTRTEYRIADPSTRWTFASTTPEVGWNRQFPQQPVLVMGLSDPQLRSFSAGERVAKPVGAAPVTAGPHPLAPIERSGDRMQIVVAGFIDADGNSGMSYTDDSGMSTRLRVLADDTVVGETTAMPAGIAQLPPGDSRVTVEFTADNPQSWNELSTHTDTRWTFHSPAVPVGETERQPIIVADYDVDVDLRNRARGRDVDLSLTNAGRSGPAEIDDVALDASYDDGRTWHAAKLRLQPDGTHRVKLPRGNGYVSLRLHAVDGAGSSLDQRIIRAWYVR